ncbi:hypothetical protein EDB87DRAFT_1607197 [Lactarius vividus]|nr:hypothetical protein EDB87DRAFT_1607197 [Lactarius vividus]
MMPSVVGCSSTDADSRQPNSGVWTMSGCLLDRGVRRGTSALGGRFEKKVNVSSLLQKCLQRTMTVEREIPRNFFSGYIVWETPAPISFRFRFDALLRCLREREQTPAEANSEALSFEGAPNNTRIKSTKRAPEPVNEVGTLSRLLSSDRHIRRLQAVHTLMYLLMPASHHDAASWFLRVVPDHEHPRSKVTYLWNMLITGKLNDPLSCHD